MKRLPIGVLLVLYGCSSGDNGALTVAITSPAQGSATNGTLTIEMALNGGTADSVTLLQGNTVLATLTTAPYRYSWDTQALPEATYALVAKAKKGNIEATSAAVNVTVDRTAPRLVFKSPGDVDVVPGQSLRLVFSEAVQASSGASVSVTTTGASPTIGALTPSSDGLEMTATIQGLPSTPATLAFSLMGGVTDRAGNSVAMGNWTARLGVWASALPTTARGNYGANFAFDSKNLPAVVWRKSDTSAPSVEKFDGTKWSSLTSSGGYPSKSGLPTLQQPIGIAFDSSDVLVIAVPEGDDPTTHFPTELNIFRYANSLRERVGTGPINTASRGPHGVALAKAPDGTLWVAFGENNEANSLSTLRLMKIMGSTITAGPSLTLKGLIEQRGLAGPHLAFGTNGDVWAAWSEQPATNTNHLGYVAHLPKDASSWTLLGKEIGHQGDVLSASNALVSSLGVLADGKPVVSFSEMLGYVWKWNGIDWDALGGLAKEFGFTAGPMLVDSKGNVLSFVREPTGQMVVLKRDNDKKDWQPIAGSLNEDTNESIFAARPSLDSAGNVWVGVREMPKGKFDEQRFILRRLNETVSAPSAFTRQDSPCVLAATPPDKISATNCYSDVAKHTLAKGVIPFAVNSPLWSDGASKRRFIVLPPGQTLTYAATGAWQLPDGAVLIKEFYMPSSLGTPTDTLMETRFLVKRDATTWEGYSYRWNVEGSEATLLSDPNQLVVKWTASDGAEHNHIYPSRVQCLTCHNETAGRTLGLHTAHLNRWFDYTPYGGAVENQLSALQSAGVLKVATGMTIDPSTAAKAVTSFDEDSPLEPRARSYFQSNCSHCHRPNGVSVTVDFTLEAPLSTGNICNKLTPGNGSGSLVVTRDSIRGPGQMPPLGTNAPDRIWLSTLKRWIDRMNQCP